MPIQGVLLPSHREALMTAVTPKFGMGASVLRRLTRVSATIREAAGA